MIANYLPKQIREQAKNSNIEEIRLRLGKTAVFECANERIVTDYIITKRDIETSLDKMCEASVYAFIDEIRQGFLTLKGGHRVGITGRVIMDRGEISNITYISSLNIRVAKEIKGVADSIIDKIKHRNTLIISPPNAGKTTLLRDITRLLGQEAKVGLADERGEIAASLFGAPSYDIGQNTDCYDLCRKSIAVGMLVRAMSPEYVVVDEIATKADTKAIQDATSLGVHVIASSHGHDYDDILKRMPRIKGIFDKIIILKRQGGEFQKEVLDV